MKLHENEKEVTIIYAIVILLAALGVAAVVIPTMEKQDESDAAIAFYTECIPKDGERVIVESNAGNWQCRERHQIMKFSQGGMKGVMK